MNVHTRWCLFVRVCARADRVVGELLPTVATGGMSLRKQCAHIAEIAEIAASMYKMYIWAHPARII